MISKIGKLILVFSFLIFLTSCYPVREQGGIDEFKESEDLEEVNEHGIENATSAFWGKRDQWADARIELHDVQALWGGRNITITESRALVEISKSGTKQAELYEVILVENEFEELINLFIVNDFLTIKVASRAGLPDEAKPEIVITNAEGEQHALAVWLGDLEKHERFNVLYQALLYFEKRASSGETLPDDSTTVNVCMNSAGEQMSLLEAQDIAQQGECGSEGTLQNTGFCNENTGTWWLDWTPNQEKPSCNPACVVKIETGEAEINWRCTGLILE